MYLQFGSDGVHSNIQPRARHNVNSRACATTPQQPLARVEIEFTFAIWHYPVSGHFFGGLSSPYLTLQALRTPFILIQHTYINIKLILSIIHMNLVWFGVSKYFDF